MPYNKARSNSSLPFINHVHHTLGLVDCTVVHDYDRPWAREHVHLIEQAIDEFLEVLGIVRTLDDVQCNNSVKRECRENRISVKIEQTPLRLPQDTNRFPRQNKTFLHALWPFIAHAWLRCATRRSKEVSSTKTSWSFVYRCETRNTYSARLRADCSAAM